MRPGNNGKGNFENKLFYHISTDEVFGSLGKEGSFNEKTSYDPEVLIPLQKPVLITW